MKTKTICWITNPKDFRAGEPPKFDFTSIPMERLGWIFVEDVIVDFDLDALLEVTRAMSGGE